MKHCNQLQSVRYHCQRSCLLLWQPGAIMGSAHQSLLDRAYCGSRDWWANTVLQCWADDASWPARLYTAEWRYHVSSAAGAAATRYTQALQSAVSIYIHAIK